MHLFTHHWNSRTIFLFLLPGYTKASAPIESMWAHFKEVWKNSWNCVWLRFVLWCCNFRRQMVVALRVLRNGTLSYWRSEARWEPSSTCDMTMILHLRPREQDAVCLSVCVCFFFLCHKRVLFLFVMPESVEKTHCSSSIFFTPAATFCWQERPERLWKHNERHILESEIRAVTLKSAFGEEMWSHLVSTLLIKYKKKKKLRFCNVIYMYWVCLHLSTVSGGKFCRIVGSVSSESYITFRSGIGGVTNHGRGKCILITCNEAKCLGHSHHLMAGLDPVLSVEHSGAGTIIHLLWS